MNKHTPGAWELNERHGGVIYVEGIGNTVAICHDDGFDIDHAEAEANARLIAAAPQMLEALEACADYWHIKHNPGDEHGELLSLSAERAQRLIRVALAAAKGEV